jgi:hypothetical protein
MDAEAVWPRAWPAVQSSAGCLCETEKDDGSAGKAGKIVNAQSPNALTEVRLRDRRDLVRH